MNTIFWAGDSTVQTNNYATYPQTGIGQVFSLFIKEGYTVVNHAKNGRSTKSFLEEGRLDAIEQQIGAGDFLFIQFGHNDEKKEDPARYTEPFSSYINNLGVFIKAARDRGAVPVLITPIERRCFTAEGKLGPGEHGDYVAGMKQAAEKYGVLLVDLYTASRNLLESAGEEASRKWYMFFSEGIYENHMEESLDNTHLRYEGAVGYARVIAEELRKAGGIYEGITAEEIRL